MSVTCHNFVQNAWKRDLCSNCFKSVGDHEGIDDAEQGKMCNSVCSEHQNGINASQTVGSNGATRVDNGANPHTTWKSLITERNEKNSQPFKLETGFKGRLLTINKAINGTERQTNGDVVKTKPSIKTPTKEGYVKATTNGYMKKHQESISSTFESKQNGSVDHKEALNNGKDAKTADQIANSSNGYITPRKDGNCEARQTKSKGGEDTQEQASVHSILKKGASPGQNGAQPRRSSNVGFIDEEPVVIGYGGRDFSPEELEWEMASEDGDGESTADSLDETEDDKVFSNITKQNTEFNSDNANLLENERRNNELMKASRENRRVDPPETNTNHSQAENPKREEQRAAIQHAEVKRSKDKKSSTQPSTEKDSDQGICDSPKTTKSPAAGSKGKSGHIETKGPNNSLNVEIKNDKPSQATKTNDAPLRTTEVQDSGVQGKNSSELVYGAPPPPSSADGSREAAGGKAANAGMFSDGEERQPWQGSGSAGSKEWQDAEEVPGQILQAINTSLANRHKMAENPEVVVEGQDPENGSNTVSVSVNNGIAEASNESSSRILTDVQGNALNVEPRDSFLHGAATKPSAIYGPASDLFVSRSNSSSSSSSSSSDEPGKISLSVNVIVKNDQGHQKINGNAEAEDEAPEGKTARENSPGVKENRKLKPKPKIPAKPTIKLERGDLNNDFKQEETSDSLQDKIDEDAAQETTYYSEIPEGSKSPADDYIDAYAEGNIYHEVNEKDILKSDDADAVSKTPGRESKLAALAVELEQARNSSTSTKRQAPAPPKIPDPPAEDPPSCTGRVSPTDPNQTFSTFRGEPFGFSSASSTTSTSSQDTEAGYASWNLHGDSDDPPKHKFKSSFLLAQYSKCKMLATGIAEDSAKARKKFSIKKLLKIGKEQESPTNNDATSPKAWKYNEHFDRPRAKLEIIHPMDLENKTVTVNPGFDTIHSGSMSSFGANPDQTSYRNSLSNSDYGSFYSDAISPAQDIKSEVNYEYIQPRIPARDDNEELSSKAGTSSSTSPTPSRSSTASHSSTVTSGSSKHGASHRPPKPPPPPRAHSLLPNNKITQNVDGTFKFPTNGDTSSSDEVTIPPKKPQPPRRQCKSTIQSAYSDSDLRKSLNDLPVYDQLSNESFQDDVKTNELERNYAKNVSTIQITHSNSQASQNAEDSNPAVQNNASNQGVYDNLVTETEPKIQASIIIQPSNLTQKEKLSKTVLTRNKQSPLSKSPARPPPIYSKPQGGNFPKNLHPWKTLEDSYLALTSSNRELLIKLVNQASKKKKNLASKMNKCQFQWSDFEIDANQVSSVFAFGEKIAYHATMPQNPEYALTLVVSVQHPQSPETTEIKYPMLGKFVDCIPSYLLDSSDDSSELEAIPATVLILDRSIIATAESYSDSLPDHLTEDHEKELAFIILQLIQSLKTLQVQGIEAIDCNFQNIILAKTPLDKYHSLIFLHDGCYDDDGFSADSCKVSLCQYTLMLLFQILKLQTAEEDLARFSSKMSRKVFVMAFSLLSEEKAVSLSQTKILLECFLWGLTKVIESLQTLDDCDSIFQRWLDIERSNFIKSIVSEEDAYDLNVQNEYYSQFLIRTSARNIKEIASYL